MSEGAHDVVVACSNVNCCVSACNMGLMHTVVRSRQILVRPTDISSPAGLHHLFCQKEAEAAVFGITWSRDQGLEAVRC